MQQSDRQQVEKIFLETDWLWFEIYHPNAIKRIMRLFFMQLTKFVSILIQDL